MIAVPNHRGRAWNALGQYTCFAPTLLVVGITTHGLRCNCLRFGQLYYVNPGLWFDQLRPSFSLALSTVTPRFVFLSLIVSKEFCGLGRDRLE